MDKVNTSSNQNTFNSYFSLSNKLNNMENDFIDDSIWDWNENSARIYKHMEELEREYEELASYFDE